MKKISLVIACILCNTFLFAETEYSLKEYFKNNILKLDPIEGFYDVEFGAIQHSPWWGSRNEVSSSEKAIRRTGENIFTYFYKNGKIINEIYFTKITDGIYNCHFCIGPYNHTQRFALEHETMFNASHRVADNKKNTLFAGEVGSAVKVDFIFNGIKSYPTSSMYLEAAKEDARKAELEYQKALEEAQRKAGWSGSGFALAQGHIVTNYHVIENAKTVLVKGIKGDFVTEYRASVVAIDKINDIAIIKISDDRFKGFGATPYKIKKSMSDVGESVWALGYPMVGVMGDEVKFTDGKISSRTGIQGDMSVYQISVPIQPGNSGGPLFDNNGNVVGITSSGLNREAFNSENVNYAIKTSYLYNLIESSMSTSILPQGTAMQGQSLTEKIKLAKKFVYIILCSEDVNFHGNNIETSKQPKSNAEESKKTDVKRTIHSGNRVMIQKPSQRGGNELKINWVDFNSKETLVNCSLLNQKLTQIGIDKNIYLVCKTNSKKYKLRHSLTMPILPKTKGVSLGSTITFTLIFEGIPSATESIDLIVPELSSWNVYDIKLK